MSVPFHETRMGRSFYETHVAEIAEQLQKIAHELKRLNEQHRAKSGGNDDTAS